MMEIDDETCQEIFLIAKKLMKLLKETYQSESVYLCTMCDEPMNHFHIQLIPRYSFEKRGSKNFVKPRFEYKEDKEKLMELRQKNIINDRYLYNELLARRYNVDVGIVETFDKNDEGKTTRTNYEVDFIVNKGVKKYYIQSIVNM